MSGLGLPILTYHALDRSGGVTSTDPSWFAETIDRLVSAGLVGVDLSDWIAQGRPAVERGFAIAFDDGLRSILDGIDAVQRHRIPVTVFLVTDHVGGFNDWRGQPRGVAKSPMLDWSECAELSRRGVRFAAHTATHPRLDRVDPTVAADELRRSRVQIENRLRQACALFAYPYGLSTPSVRHRVACGFDAAFGTRMALANAQSSLHDLPRIDAYYLKSSSVIDRLISGRLRQWLRVRRVLRGIRRVAGSVLPVAS
jgi:peptidoglycan/xylan/chitin deacetylase (PgdA/CDA1 family)